MMKYNVFLFTFACLFFFSSSYDIVKVIWVNENRLVNYEIFSYIDQFFHFPKCRQVLGQSVRGYEEDMYPVGMRNFFVEEGSFMGGFGSYLKFLTVVSTVFGLVLYYVPVSRSCE